MSGELYIFAFKSSFGCEKRHSFSISGELYVVTGSCS